MRYFIALVACLSLTGTESTSDVVEDSNSLLCISGESNQTEALSRRRRYLSFEKGAAVTFAVSSVKTIISGIPRGMNMVSEVTLYYELPWLLSQVKLPIQLPTQPPTQPPRQPPPKWVSDWESWSVPEHTFVSPAYAHTRYMQERAANPESGFLNVKDMAEIFFQQIRQFAENYGYNDRHCVLRTICDAKHRLYPEGQSLLHDVIKILLETYMARGLVHDQKYLNAWGVKNPMDCANLYGPHCRISFLEHITTQIYGKMV